MITGTNSRLAHGGAQYDVQTEDLEREHCLLTLVFRAGAVVARRRVPYPAGLGMPPDPMALRAALEAQHQDTLQAVKADRFAPGSAPAADPTLNDLIDRYLRSRGLLPG